MAFDIGDLKDRWQSLIPTEDRPADAIWTIILAEAQEAGKADTGNTTLDDSIAAHRQLFLWEGALILKTMVSSLSDAESSGAGSVTFPSTNLCRSMIKHYVEIIGASEYQQWYHQEED